MLLATFKHISSKNADYSAAEAYLTFEHDEFTMKPTLDENGRLIPRQDYRIATLNCGDEDFAIACLRANLRYGKNQKREDIKSHHYIISFDPKDVPDHGLTVDRAQQLGEEYCKRHFPGHQAIVCTHPNGHNGSGNIHVHIVINSLRIMEFPFMPYMDRPCDTQPGMKHRCTNTAMEYFRSEVMEMCHDAGLYQIDLLNGSRTRITKRKYWAKKHNLKNASRAYLLYQEMGFDSPEELAAACDTAHEKLSDIRTEMKSAEAAIAEKKEFRNHVLNYHKTKYVLTELEACKNEKARQKYRDEHDSDFIILNAAKRYFDSKGLKKLPSYKALQTEVEQLIKEKNELYNQYQTAKEEAQRLDTIRHNLEQTLGRKIEHKKEQER